MHTVAYGFPRLGAQREYKRAIEGCWREDFVPAATASLERALQEQQRNMVSICRSVVDEYADGEMTPYDYMLDMALLAGRYPVTDWRDYYDLCRGSVALEMTKWFNTNYHYLVPDFSTVRPSDLALNREWFKRLTADRLAADRGSPRFFIGPYTFLRLSKGISGSDFGGFLRAMALIYRQLLAEFASVHIHEPALILDGTAEHFAHIEEAYRIIAEAGTPISLFTYYDSVDLPVLTRLYELPLRAIGLDLLRGAANIEDIVSHGFPADKRLIAGLVDGRSVWRTNIDDAAAQLRRLSAAASDLAVSNAAPLFHLPVSLAGEELDERLMRRLAFATEKLAEIRSVADVYAGRSVWQAPQTDDFGVERLVQTRVSALQEADFKRMPDYSVRAPLQSQRFRLPLFPTTTIGSFPQTADVRRARARYRRGELDDEQYRTFIRDTIADTVGFQERIGLDVLVHGESERSDMVEFFAEQLEGIATTKNGWVISYGTRGYRPPIIYGDISRPKPMTIEEIGYAQQLTSKPVKGMLTGPITIIAWSFVRSDIELKQVAYQIALALQDEVADYEQAGIGMVQIDEPAFREMAPNKRRDWKDYFEWAVRAFRLCSAKARPETQIHSHMCYSEFNEILDRIEAMDFDVISIEATRSHGEVVDSFAGRSFNRQIGLGVYDIHSPALPSSDDIAAVVLRAIKTIAPENFWINPDCGLKTRRWEEVEAALTTMVREARALRSSAATSAQTTVAQTTVAQAPAAERG